MEMGFPQEACKKALFFTKNAGMEPATEWIMEHMADSDFEDTFIPPGTNRQRKFFELFFFQYFYECSLIKSKYNFRFVSSETQRRRRSDDHVHGFHDATS